MRDLYNNISNGVQSIAIGAKTADVTGTGVDLQGFQGALVHIEAGTKTDGTHTPKLQESDVEGSGYTDVAAENQLGTFAAIASDTRQRVGYIGTKRYIRVFVTVAGATTGAVYGAVVFKGFPRHAPVS